MTKLSKIIDWEMEKVYPDGASDTKYDRLLVFTQAIIDAHWESERKNIELWLLRLHNEPDNWTVDQALDQLEARHKKFLEEE